ncbi:MAG: EAL domain-containing protein [Halothece sp.]
MKPEIPQGVKETLLETLRLDIQLNLLERAINASSNGIIITDAQQQDNPIIYINEAFERITGYTFNEVVGYNCRFLQGNDCEQPGLKKIRMALQQGQECCTVLRNYRKDGSQFWNELYISPVKDVTGKITNFIGVQNDITERKLAEEKLKASEQQFRIAFENAPVATALVALNGSFLEVNESLCKLLGYSKQELMARSLLEISHPDEITEGKLLYRRCLQGEINNFQLEKCYVTQDGNTISALVKVTLVRDDNDLPIYYIVQIWSLSCRLDEQETRKNNPVASSQLPAQTLRHHLHYDGLTGLPTRILFEASLEQGLQYTGKECAVFFLDLDRFQVINESLGHHVGDQLLISISSRLQSSLKDHDFIARSGGDEFAIFVGGVKTLLEAMSVAKTIQDQLTHPFTLKTSEGEITTSYNFITTSIGIALGWNHQEKGAQLLQDAEIAIGRAKKKGKASIEVFDQTLREKVLRQSRIETDLKQAISRGELYLEYQPIINLATGKLKGFEALVRWQHFYLGMISPGEFIPIAEETGLIVPIGYWILSQACEQLKAWQQSFPEFDDLTMSVNLSALQIKDPALVKKVQEILEQSNLSGENLKLEITETALIENVELATQQLEKLKENKIKISLDDFGTGYASLSYLQRFPVDILKIDRSFISAMTPDNHNFKIVQGVISLGHALEMQVIGEGVETDYQREELHALGCEFGQGYYFAKPLNVTKATEFLSSFPQSLE